MCLCYYRMVDIEVQTQSQVIQADSEGDADPTYSPSYLSGDDDIYVVFTIYNNPTIYFICNAQLPT